MIIPLKKVAEELFTMITTGIANKTGYNWEINGGKLIIQPSIFTGYVMVNTKDYYSKITKSREP